MSSCMPLIGGKTIQTSILYGLDVSPSASKHPDVTKQIEPSSKAASAAPHQGLPVSEITWEGCCLHKQEKLTLSLLGFTYNFATDCSSTRISTVAAPTVPLYWCDQQYCTVLVLSCKRRLW